MSERIKTTEYSLRDALKMARFAMREAKPTGADGGLRVDIHIHWFERILVAAEAQHAALKFLKDRADG
jgi:hypothetical protein